MSLVAKGIGIIAHKAQYLAFRIPKSKAVQQLHDPVGRHLP